MDDYYSTILKKDRIESLKPLDNFHFKETDICDVEVLDKVFEDSGINVVINLAAQVGVRYSLKNPYKYIQSNVTGFLNVLECCKKYNIEHLIFASSSSVYGANNKVPYSTDDTTDYPISLYAATKKADELMAYSYASLYGLPVTGLRIFTVYGPWGRPDMSYSLFAEKIYKGQPIQLFNGGDMVRDFTYIDDIVKSFSLLINKPPGVDTTESDNTINKQKANVPYNIFNLGNNKPVTLLDFVATLEKHIGKKAIIESLPMQPGDMYKTHADIDSLVEYIGYSPSVNVDEGIEEFVNWYQNYYF